MRAVLISILIAAVAGLVCADVWWESALIYQIYPRSFKDSNGDGIGDLNGITEKLSYLKDTGVDAIWLSPIYTSPMYDFGYDITNYTEISPEYGTMEDFDNLMAEAKKMGIRVVLDYVPNHTSNESDWFIKSAKREPGYEDYYVWANGKPNPNPNSSKLLPPNNWVSIFRKSAWEYHPIRRQFYLHQFVIGQPDLNYRNSRVQNEMKNVLRFWLNKGVSGFRIDAVNIMYEVDPSLHNGTYPDEPRSGAPNTNPDDYEYLNHIYTKNMNETYEVVYDWRELLDEYIPLHHESKVMMTECYADLSDMIRYYGDGTRDGSVPFNFLYLEGLTKNSNAENFKSVIENWITHMPAGSTANWVNGNHDQSRVGTRHGVKRIDAMNMLALILPGISLTYQGEEIGMTDGSISWEETKDPQACNTDDRVNYWKKSRDPARTPYQWDDSKHAGFSNTNNATWLPVAQNYREVNLAAQINNNKSHYTFYKDVVAIKKSPAVRKGNLVIEALSKYILVVTRQLKDNPGFASVINLSNQEQKVNLSGMGLTDKLQVAASGIDCSLEKGTQVAKTDITLSPHCALVLTTITTPAQNGTTNGGTTHSFFMKPLFLSVSVFFCTYFYIKI